MKHIKGINRRLRAMKREKDTASQEDDSVVVKKRKIVEYDKTFKLSRKRKISVKKMNTTILVDIREFYTKDDEEKPGRKGISLTEEQFHEFVKHIDEIKEAIEQLKKG
eukprot:snap_masked-scaffold_31-processed-gene-3.23-mRNA-1 protein AED:0.11 eAED:0.11 QI:0/0/0/0.5/1/1/2/0/107